MSQDEPRTGSPAHPAPYDEFADDPPPFTYLDNPGRAAGAMPPGVTIGYGVFFLAAAAVLLAILIVNTHADFAWAGLFSVVLFGAIGGVVLYVGLARRAWRKRHPGVDPLAAERTTPSSGSAFGPDTAFARVCRVVLLALCWGFAAICVVALGSSLSHRDPALSTGAWVGSLAVLAGLVCLFAAVGWYDLRRILVLRRERHTSAD